MKDLELIPGDILLTASRGWLGRAIRRAERGPGESASLASHAGLIVEGGAWPSALVSEAVGRGVCLRTLHPYAEDGTPVKILRPLNLTGRDMEKVCNRALAVSDHGARYGFGQLVLHGGDALLSGLRGREVVFFRRAIHARTFTTCARHVADCYRAAGFDFGVSADLCTPDHIDDYATAHPERYLEVWPWGQLPESYQPL